ncbi:DNA gyrase subunit A [bacterium]|nr:DNA gyrase subunit A [candidate division CSSED10-310 bacterium]
MLNNKDQKIVINIEDTMKSAFIDYAMSVIVGRALPDVRDGLKPVHRRILYGMNQMGLTFNRPYRKSAKVVGEVMGNFHPHGDQAIYDALVRMAQDFSMRYMLADGQGNFGSVDGDPPAAMRYTEVRMARIASEMLRDIDKETVSFVPNYDDSTSEPEVLPAAIPNLLVNGSSGIAVGMATNIPPHNLGEIIDALIHIIAHPGSRLSDIQKIVKGPDFPTGGFIHGRSGIRKAYESGRGSITMRAKAVVEIKQRTGRENIVVTELPYQVNKATLIEKIADLVKDKKITGISDLRDESDRDGMRIVIELKKDQIAKAILNQLYKHTALQANFGVNMVALVDGKPEQLALMDILLRFLEHRRDVVIRRTQFLLKKAEDRAHILEGLIIALDNLDAVISLIRNSRNAEDARTGLMTTFKLSQAQSQAILDMRLQRLTGLERDKIRDEYLEILKEINRLKAILGSESLLMNVIKEELLEIKEKYADERRTLIVDDLGEIDFEDMIVEEDMVVFITDQNYAKRNPLSLYRAQKRRGQGATGIIPKEGDYLRHLFVASTHDTILIFTDKGQVHKLKVYQLPQAGRAAKGSSLKNLLSLGPEENVAAILPIQSFQEDRFILMVTKNGIIKKTTLTDYSNIRSGGIRAIIIDDEDELIAVRLTNGSQHVFMATHLGMSIRFDENDARSMGRVTRGVIGIRLEEGDHVVGMEVLKEGAIILTVTQNGFGKRTSIDEYRIQKRGGKGLINIKVTHRNGPVVGILQSFGDDEFLMITDIGKIIRIRVDLESLRTIGRSTQGVKLQDLGADGNAILAIAPVLEREVSGDEDLGDGTDRGADVDESAFTGYEDDNGEEIHASDADESFDSDDDFDQASPDDDGYDDDDTVEDSIDEI